MPLIKLDRDMLLDMVYECRGKIDFENKEALEKIRALVDLIIRAPELESQNMFPKIKIGR